MTLAVVLVLVFAPSGGAVVDVVELRPYPTRIACMEAGFKAQVEHRGRLISWDCKEDRRG